MPAYITPMRIDAWFTYHPPSPGQPELYRSIREAAKALALNIMQNTPEGPDQTTAIRCVREAVMWANASIATHDAIVRGGVRDE